LTKNTSKLFVFGVLLSGFEMIGLARERATAGPSIYARTVTSAQVDALENYNLLSLKTVHFSVGRATQKRRKVLAR